MPKKNTPAIVRKMKTPTPPTSKFTNKPLPKGIVTAFENKAGRYELTRIDGDQAHYSFTNLQKKTVDATMPLLMWNKMQERAAAALKETA